MLSLKAFVSIAAMQNNDPEIVSPIGELSDKSNSFAREKFKYLDQASMQCELIVFESKEGNGYLPTPLIHQRKALEFSQWIYTQALDGRLNSDVEVFKSRFLTQFGGQIERFECGTMVSGKQIWMPAFIRYRLVGQPDNAVRLWYADQAFQAQYDSYEIYVIPPIKPVDTFMNTTSVVAKALESFSFPQHQLDINAASNNVPYTRHKTNDYMWYAPDNPESTLITYWSAIVYGGSVVNDDMIRDAIADYILNNSKYGRDQWLPVFPDIFASRGFVIAPAWNKPSTYDATPRGSLYSPVFNVGEDVAIANKFSYDRKEAHNKVYTQTTVAQWKSLGIVAISNVENDKKRMRLTDIYPDYALISPSSTDFNRMSFDTTDFVKKLIQGLVIAEEFDEYSILAEGYYQLDHKGVKYITFNHLKVDYMIVTRSSYLAVMGS